MPTPIRVQHKTDPKTAIWDDVKSLVDGFLPMGDRILVVVYERGKQKNEEARTAGGIIVPEVQHGVLGEDKFQGRVGLVVAKGPLAFVEDDTHHWGDRCPDRFDWVMFDTVNTSPFDLPGGRRARFVQDIYVEAIVPNETFDAIW
jgi:co-chaperonin GroES (HSP10)